MVKAPSLTMKVRRDPGAVRCGIKQLAPSRSPVMVAPTGSTTWTTSSSAGAALMICT